LQVNETINLSSNSQTISVVPTPSIDQLTFNTKYYWRVKVFNTYGLDSGWVSGVTFTTVPHAYPNPTIAFSPVAPLVKDNVCLTGSATYSGTAGSATWAWSLDNGTGTSSIQNPPCKTYSSTGTYAETLKVCDPALKTYPLGGCCSVTTNIPVKNFLNLPQWKEISPF